MVKSKAHSLGNFEESVLLAVHTLNGNAYGVTIQQFLETVTNGFVSIGAVYATLDRLQRKGLVSSWEEESLTPAGTRIKRFFKVTETGIIALQREKDIKEKLWSFVVLPVISTVCLIFLFVVPQITHMNSIFLIFVGGYNISKETADTKNQMCRLDVTKKESIPQHDKSFIYR